MKYVAIFTIMFALAWWLMGLAVFAFTMKRTVWAARKQLLVENGCTPAQAALVMLVTTATVAFIAGPFVGSARLTDR